MVDVKLYMMLLLPMMLDIPMKIASEILVYGPVIEKGTTWHICFQKINFYMTVLEMITKRNASLFIQI